jgi:hypothetical protein
VSRDKSVRRSAQDDDFVGVGDAKDQRLPGFLLSAKQVSAHGTTSWAKFSRPFGTLVEFSAACEARTLHPVVAHQAA